jgi:CBS domain containing-hemolysin-like protein
VELQEEEGRPTHLVVVGSDGAVTGVLSRDWALAHSAAFRAAHSLTEVASRDYVVVPGAMTVFHLLSRMQRARASVAVVEEAHGVLGVVTNAQLAELVAEGMELFAD